MSNDMLGMLLRKIVGLPAEMLGSLYDFVEKLSGEDGKAWIFAFKRFLRKENPWQGASFPTWKTIKLGTGLKTTDDFRKALKASGNRISDWASDILGKPAFTVADKETQVELAKATVKELTGKDQATYGEICQRAEERGWKKCPAEVGPQLRLQYPDQPYGEWLVVVMEPIIGSDGGLKLFYVMHDDGSYWLSSSHGSHDILWGADSGFVFCK